MKIIDSKTDYYDFYQNVYRDDSLTFDRRDSFNVSKKDFASHFQIGRIRWGSTKTKQEIKRNKYILLQVCNTFWLIKLIITDFDDYDWCTDYNLELMGSWKDYSKPPELIKLSEIYRISHFYYTENDNKKIIDAVKNGEYEILRGFNRHINSRFNKQELIQEEKHIPILKDIGVSKLIDASDIYLAIEEYFSLAKTKNERTESIGLTDVEKIENHGFNKKTSFRGK